MQLESTAAQPNATSAFVSAPAKPTISSASPLFGASTTTSGPFGAASTAASKQDCFSTATNSEVQNRREGTINEHMPRAVIDMKHQAPSQRSFASLQGQLSKLTGMLSSLNTSIVASPVDASFVVSTPKFASLSTTNASTKPSATAFVAPQVFGEMPTPRWSQGTHGSAPDCRFGHHTPIQSTCLRDGNNNLSEQNADRMPQSYGFHNLNRQSIFGADGTEHHYYALPETYLLAQATPQPVFDVSDEETKDCSNEFRDVFTSSLEQLAMSFHKAPESASSEQLPKCVSKPPETEETSKYMRKASENETHSSHSPRSATATDILQFQAFEGLPVFDGDDDKTDGCSSVFVDVFARTPEQQKYEVEQHERHQAPKCFSIPIVSPEQQIFEEEATEFAFAHDHVIQADMSIKIKNEKSTQAASTSVQGATRHCADEISEINFKKQDVLIDKYDISDSKPDVSFLKSDISPCQHPCDLSNDKEELLWNLGSVRSTTGGSISVLKFGVREAYPILPCIWDPGIDRFSYKKLHLLCWHEDIKCNGIALWLITFNPP